MHVLHTVADVRYTVARIMLQNAGLQSQTIARKQRKNNAIRQVICLMQLGVL